MAEALRTYLSRFGPWILGALLLTVYLKLPDDDAPLQPEEIELGAPGPEKLDIVDVRPLDPCLLYTSDAADEL